MSSQLQKAVVLVSAMAVLGADAPAQQSSGTLMGLLRIREPQGVIVRLEESGTGATVETVSPDSTGRFVFRDVPFATYDVTVYRNGELVGISPVTVNSTVPASVDVDSAREFRLSEIAVQRTVPGGPRPAASHTLFTQRTLQDLPGPSAAKAIESLLLSCPGVVPDEDGRLHVRGEDAQLQYVVDGIPITGNMTRVYASLFDAETIKSADVQTGGLPAEYGGETGGVVAITTKSGFDGPFTANASAAAGSFRTGDYSLQVRGPLDGTTALYVAARRETTDRYLDPIAEGDPIHDAGSTTGVFGKVGALLGPGVDATVLGLFNTTTYEIPNSPVRSPTQDQRQKLDNALLAGRVNVSLGDGSLLSVLGHYHINSARITSGGLEQLASPADYPGAIRENERFFIGGDRRYTTAGAQVEISKTPAWFASPNNFKAGLDAAVIPVHEFFTFAVTNPAVSNPDSSVGDARFLPYDITQGGRPFLVNRDTRGFRSSAYVQDVLFVGDLAVSAGIRFDAFNVLRHETAVSPRAGLSLAVTPELVLRASYSRVVNLPPVENYLVSSSAEAAELAATEQQGIPTTVRSERSHVFELGATYGLNEFVNVDVAGYLKLVDDLLAQVELGNSGVIFPVNLKQGQLAGGEVRVSLREWKNLSGTLSFCVASSRALIPADGSSPVDAGLILGEEGHSYSHPFGGEGSFPTEHNQLLTAVAGVAYHHPAGLLTSLNARFDSGLPFDLAGPDGVGLDEAQARVELRRRGYSDAVINLLNLSSEEPGSPDKSVAPHLIFSAAVGFDAGLAGWVPVTITLDVINVFNTPYLYRFESQFGGTHFGTPRMILLQMGVRV